GGHARPLPEHIDAETGEAGDPVREVTVETLAERLLLILGHDGEDEGLALLGGERRGLVGHQLAAHAEHGGQTDLHVNVGRVQLDGEAEDGVELRRGRLHHGVHAINPGSLRQLVRRRSSSKTVKGMDRKVATTAGSKCVPAQRSISARAASRDTAREYGRSKVMASRASATAKMRAPRGMCSP